MYANKDFPRYLGMLGIAISVMFVFGLFWLWNISMMIIGVLLLWSTFRGIGRMERRSISDDPIRKNKLLFYSGPVWWAFVYIASRWKSWRLTNEVDD